MLASRTIISANGNLSGTTHLFELRDYFFLVHFGQCSGEPVSGGPEFSKLSRFEALSWSGDVNAQSFSTARDGHGRPGFQEPGNLFAKLAHSNFDCRHCLLHAYT